jgi:hypothetical protein
VSLPNGNRTGGTAKKSRTTVKLLNLLLAAVIVFLSLSLLGNSMTKELGRDEHVYCTAGYLTAQGKLIYRDFSYITHPPYYPLLLALLYKATGTSYYLLVGRIFSVGCEVGILVCIVAVIRSILKNYPKFTAVFSICALLIYAMNPFVIYACGYAWNHSAVVLCVLFCLWLFTNMDLEKTNFRRLFIIGAVLTLAAFIRHTTALAYCVFAVTILSIAPKRLKKGKSTALPFIAGTLVFAIWPLFVIRKAPEAFFLDVIRIPALNVAFLRETGPVYDKLQLTKVALLGPAYIGLIILVIYLGVLRFILADKNSTSDKLKERLFAAVAAVFAVIVFIPPMMWVQYWALPVAFIVAALAQPLNHLCNAAARDTRRKPYTVIAAILLVAATGACLYEALPSAIVNAVNAFNPDTWVPIRVHKISEDIHRKAVAGGPVLTLSPLYAIEGGSEIYPEFSAGPFVYRIADRLSDSQKDIVHGAGAAELKKLIESNPPSAVILGTEPKLLEEPILKQVAGADWRREDYGENLPVIYFRKVADEPPAAR